ncbi:O-methyltransferase [Candidatus Cloacimonadota bacterium]
MEMSFKEQLESHQEELEQFLEQKNNIRRLWNICDATAEYIYNMILKTKPDHILEIGSSNGYSTFWLSLAAEQINATLDSIEVDEQRYKMARDNLADRNNVNLINGLAEQIIPEFLRDFNFVFIDAGKIGYIEYLKLLINKLAPGAIIIADNVISHKETVRDYLDYLNKSSLFETRTLNIGSGLEISSYQPQ